MAQSRPRRPGGAWGTHPTAAGGGNREGASPMSKGASIPRQGVGRLLRIERRLFYLHTSPRRLMGSRGLVPWRSPGRAALAGSGAAPQRSPVPFATWCAPAKYDREQALALHDTFLRPPQTGAHGNLARSCPQASRAPALYARCTLVVRKIAEPPLVRSII